MSLPVTETPVVAPAPNGSTDEPLFEIIDGQRVELPPMSVLANVLAGHLFGELYLAAKSARSGWALMEVLVKLPLPVDRNRRPDLAFVSYTRWPQDKPLPNRENALAAAPELAVEVVSPTDLATEITEKLLEYFQAGAQLVWLVYPEHQLIYVYDAPTSCRILTRQDVLDGGRVLPNFRLPLAELFPEPPPPPTTGS